MGPAQCPVAVHDGQSLSVVHVLVHREPSPSAMHVNGALHAGKPSPHGLPNVAGRATSSPLAGLTGLFCVGVAPPHATTRTSNEVRMVDTVLLASAAP
jgi:hypothetical protein